MLSVLAGPQVRASWHWPWPSLISDEWKPTSTASNEAGKFPLLEEARWELELLPTEGPQPQIYQCCGLIAPAPPFLFLLILTQGYVYWFFRERRREKEKERNIDVRGKHWLATRHTSPHWRQPRHVPWLGAKLTTFQCVDDAPTNWDTQPGGSASLPCVSSILTFRQHGAQPSGVGQNQRRPLRSYLLRICDVMGKCPQSDAKWKKAGPKTIFSVI